jgi:phospholipid/cholesterol/gamma-HCH transport system substrate-binding protein
MWNRFVGVGLFVVAGTALFMAAVFLIGNQHSIFAKHVEIFTEVKDLNGLAKGATVRVAGLDAGEVTEIAVPQSPSAGFRLKLQISEKVRGLVRADSVATIATEGVVGDKVLLIQAGTATAPEAAPGSTLRSKETSDITDLVQKGATLVDKSTTLIGNATETMKVVADRLTNTLDSVTTAVNNTNDVVVGVKEGRGAIGMLLRDESTATDIKAAVSNVRDATSSLSHAAAQADALASDFQSRNFGAKADAIISDIQSRNLGEKIEQTMDTVQSAAKNIDATSRDLHSAVETALAPDSQGRTAADNVRTTLSSVNDATANLVDDSEALKHGFLFRGFFKKRGYYSMARLEPDKYRKDKVFANPKNPRIWLDAGDLFESDKGENETLSRAGKARIDSAIAEFGDRLVGGGIVIEGYAASGASTEELACSRRRAILVRNYLQTRFQLDAQNIGTVPLRGVPPPSTRKDTWNGVCIMLLSRPS